MNDDSDCSTKWRTSGSTDQVGQMLSSTQRSSGTAWFTGAGSAEAGPGLTRGWAAPRGMPGPQGQGPRGRCASCDASRRSLVLSKASFGKFRIVGQIARGGMAEVFLCRLQGIGGFEKDVVVKCIIPERADDPNFVTMFLDEARV